LFSAGTYSGSFTNLVLPTLAPNLAWSTSTLSNSGTISVVALTPPNISSFNISGGNFVIAGTGGPGNWPFYVLSSTNLSLPLPQWMRIATNQFDASGNFSLTNALNPVAPQQFYLLQLQ
jgi:hypothetical protein